MKKLLLIPAIIFPYSVCLCLAYGFISGNFSDNIITAIAIGAVACLALAFICNLIFILATKNTPPKELLKAALLIKLIHIPTYILIFALGLIMGLMFFMTFPFIVFLVLVDVITLFLSSMISVYALIKNMKSNSSVSVVALICQFCFCADVISVFIANLIIGRVK